MEKLINFIETMETSRATSYYRYSFLNQWNVKGEINEIYKKIFKIRNCYYYLSIVERETYNGKDYYMVSFSLNKTKGHVDLWFNIKNKGLKFDKNLSFCFVDKLIINNNYNEKCFLWGYEFPLYNIEKVETVINYINNLYESDFNQLTNDERLFIEIF